MDFLRLYHILTHGTCRVKIPTELITEYIWPMLSFPHQGRAGYEIRNKNKCLKQLPSLEMWSGPKIIYKTERLGPLFHPAITYNYPATVKFMYTLKYYKKYPNEYINILEYVTLQPSDFEYTKVSDEKILYWKDFSAKLREIYHLPLLNNKKNLLLSTPIINEALCINESDVY